MAAGSPETAAKAAPTPFCLVLLHLARSMWVLRGAHMQLRIRHMTARLVCLAGGVAMIWTSIRIVAYDRIALPHPSSDSIRICLSGIGLVLGVLAWSAWSIFASTEHRQIPRGFDVIYPAASTADDAKEKRSGGSSA